MNKIRLTRAIIMEYEPNPEYYPEGSTIEEIAQYDCDSDDQDLLFHSDAVISDNTTYEIIN